MKKTFVKDSQSGQDRLPYNLQQGIEQLSGLAMDDVRVHYNSPKPAHVSALAYAQGKNIYLGPGQEKHIAHEAWHVVQQKQGRVKPTLQLKTGEAINDSRMLEREADVMGAHAERAGYQSRTSYPQPTVSMDDRRPPVSQCHPIQRTLADAKVEAKRLYQANLDTKEDVQTWLQSQEKPNKKEGVDRVREAYNQGLPPYQWLMYSRIWPPVEAEPEEKVAARAWVADFLRDKDLNQLGSDWQSIHNIRGLIADTGRSAVGMDMLNKFLFYGIYGSTIQQHLLSNYSPNYAKHLNDELSMQLGILGHAAVNDELFKDLQGAEAEIAAMIAPAVLPEFFQLGLKHLNESIAEGVDLSVIVDHYFLHDKGYRNATVKFNQADQARVLERVQSSRLQRLDTLKSLQGDGNGDSL